MSDAVQDVKQAASLGTHLIPLRRNWGWLLGLGIALIILGVFGLGMTPLLSIASAIWFGALMFIAGIMLLIDAFRHSGWKSLVWHTLIGLIYLGVGIMTFFNPLAATVSLTLVVGAMLVATGILRSIIAFQTRPLAAWVWVLISGLLSLFLGGLIIYQWPGSSAWVLGTFMAVELIFQGWACIALARAVRSTFDGTITPKTA